MAKIEIRDAWKSFGSKQVLAGLSIEIQEGETHVIIGRSGEGKSVMLKLICGLIHPDKGEVFVDGKCVYKPNRSGSLVKCPETLEYIRRNVSMVFQMAALFDSLTVLQNVGFYHLERGEKKMDEIRQIVAGLLEEVNLPNTEDLMPAELSGGMRKRVGLARALAHEPEIILYDEPTTGLDPVTSDVINDLIINTRNNHNVTSIVVTHDMNSAYKVADRISMLYEGKIIFSGTPDDVKNSRNPFVHQFVNGLADGPITRLEEDDVQSRCSHGVAKLP